MILRTRVNRLFQVAALLAVSLAPQLASAADSPQPASKASAAVAQIKVQPDQAPDCSSIKAMAESVTRDCKTNDERAIAIYNFMQLTHYHRQYPSEPGGIPVLKEINVYGWSLCGGLHAEQSALWRALGWDWRFVGWDGHTTVEAGYDGRWHYVDVFLKFYAWMPDPAAPGGRTIAGEDDLNNNAQTLIRDAFVVDPARKSVYAKNNQFTSVGDQTNWRAPSFLGCGDELEGVIGGLKTHHGRDRVPGWGGIEHEGNYSADVNLAPGFALTNMWDPVEGAWYWPDSPIAPGHTCPAYKDTRNDPGIGLILEPYINSRPARSYGSGVLSFTPDFSDAAVLNSFDSSENVKLDGKSLAPADGSKPAVLICRLASPYVLTKASGTAGAATAEVSVDEGKSYKAIDLKNFDAAVKGHLTALVRLSFKEPINSLKLEATLQNNPGALPYLSPGKNKVTVSVADSKALGKNKLVVTYAYRLGSRTKSFEQLAEEGKEIAKQHNASWDDTLTYVQKTFAASDLPATFDIDCPTPKGRYPIYPRMLFLRREVLAPGASPLPPPSGAVAATAAKADELVSLPNPFMVGTTPPPLTKSRPTKTVRLPLKYVEYRDENGQSSAKGILRWPKVAAEQGKVVAGAVLLDGDLKELPAKKSITAARLCVPVVQGHDKAPGQLGAVLLKSPLPAGAKLPDLSDIAATVVVPKQPTNAAQYTPPKTFSLDLTQQIRAVAGGDKKFSGIALRIVPNRSIDDGYTVRCEISPSEPLYLEIEQIAD